MSALKRLTARAKSRSTRIARGAQAGFSLIELMVGMTIGLVIVGAAIVIFSSSRVNSNASQEQARLEDAARYVQRMMQSSVGQAGYLGCISRSSQLTSLLNSSSSYLYNFAQPVFGSYGNGASFSPALDSNLPGGSGAPNASSDVLVTRGADYQAFRVLSPYAPASGATAVTINANAAVKAGSIVAVGNCSKTVIFQNSGSACSTASSCALGHATGGSTPGNASSSLTLAINGDAEAVLPQTSAFFVARSQRCINGSTSNCPSYSLWRQDGSDAAQEMVEGVEKMTVRYRVDNNIGGGGGRLLRADQVQSASLWPSVVGVEATFILASVQPIGTGSQTLAGTTYTDRRVRRQVKTAINLRNMSQ